jgi:hypothetical protein
MSLPPGVVARPSLDPSTRRAEIEALYRRRRRTVAAVAVGLAVLLIGVAVVVLVSRGKSSSSDAKAVFERHQIALSTIDSSNSSIASHLDSLSSADRPDLSTLTKSASEATPSLGGLVVPTTDGSHAGLARNLQSAIDAEQKLLGVITGLSRTSLADLSDQQLGDLSDAAGGLESALRTSYADQPKLSIPDLSALTQSVQRFVSAMRDAREAADARQQDLGDLNDYANAVAGILSQLDGLRKQLTTANLSVRTIKTTSARDAAESVVDAARSGRERLANSLANLNPPAELEDLQSELVADLSRLASVVGDINNAISDADCSYDYSYDSSTDCDTIGSTSAWADFVEESKDAGDAYDADVAEFNRQVRSMRADLS